MELLRTNRTQIRIVQQTFAELRSEFQQQKSKSSQTDLASELFDARRELTVRERLAQQSRILQHQQD